MAVSNEKIREIYEVLQHTTRTVVHGIFKRFITDEKDKLKVILTSWTEPNKQHSAKFRKWTEKVENIESDPIYNRALQAAKELEKANEQLAQVLGELQGAR